MKFFIIISLSLALVGCSYDVPKELIDKAEKFCSNNEGLASIERTLNYGMIVCKNGGVLTLNVNNFK